MKFFTLLKNILSFGIIILLFRGCSSPGTPGVYGEGPQFNSFDSLIERFYHPPASFRPVIDWGWNCRVTRDKIDFQLEEFHRQHYGGIFHHPHPGLITEYLSDEYFEMVDYTVQRAGELGMSVWLSDEFYSQSGSAGGHVQAEMPGSYNRGKGLRLIRKERIEPGDTSWIFIGLEKQETGFRDITDVIEHKAGQTGDYYLFKKTFNEAKNKVWGYPYPDLLVPGVTEKFISVTMTGYENAVGEAFGEDLRGVYMDEPHIDPQTGPRDIRWTPTLFEDFQEMWGYDLRSRLPFLLEDQGNYRRVRHSYHQLLSILFTERWCRPWLDFTEKKNLLWVGHYYEHEWPRLRKTGGDNMYLHVWNHIPGVDYLGGQYGDILPGRQLGSIAGQFNKTRAQCQSYPASGWSIDFEEIKRLGDWEYVLGANFMNQFSAFMTLRGARKREWPLSFSWHNPWWPCYHKLIDYFGRLSVLLSSGEKVNRILVMEPTTTVWMYFSPSGDKDHRGTSAKVDRIGDRFRKFLDYLEARQVEYDLGSEMVLRDFGGVEGNTLKIGRQKYDLVILGPGMENVNESTADNLEEYLRNGGDVVSFGSLPRYSNGRATDRFEQLCSGHEGQWKQFADWDNQEFPGLVTGEDLRVILPDPLPEKLYHHRRVFSDGQLIFWENFNEDSKVSMDFLMKGKSVSLLDAVDGFVYEYPAEKEGVYMKIRLYLLPGQSKLFFLHEKRESPGKPWPAYQSWEPLEAGPVTEMNREEPNVLVLDYCDLQLGGKKYESIYYIDAAGLIFKEHGFEVSRIDHNPWNFTIQYKTTILDMADFAKGTGFEAGFFFRTRPDYIPGDLRLAVEYGHLYTVLVNGHEVKPLEDQWWLDRSLNVYDISEAVKAGTNRVLLKLHPMHIHAELERVFVLGDFALEPAEKGFVMIPPREMQPGSWRKQGMPFYFSGVSYAREFRLEEKKGSYKVRLDQWNGTVAAVMVNGREAGIIGWKPYELDITGHLKRGSNRVEVKVCGSLKNLLGPHYFAGNLSMVTPWSFNEAPVSQPPGDAYELLDYGLFNDLQILATDRQPAGERQ